MISDAVTRFLDISPYVGAPLDLQPPLSSNMHAEVAIVGGGYTGLSTALALHERGISAVILERHFCGYGASGRNGGHLTPAICKDLPTATMLFGNETAAKFVRYADFCVKRTEETIKAYGINCDYNDSGNIRAVVHGVQEKRLRKATEVAIALGAKMHFVEPAEMRERGIPVAFRCGAMEELGGTLHPGKFVSGLRKAALARGIRIFEQTRVEHIEDKSNRLITQAGTLSAENVLMATNAYTAEIGEPGDRIAPLYITFFETAPLSDAQIAEIGGWKGREGIHTAHESMESYRLTSQRTIIGGSKDVQFFYDCAPHNHGGERDARKMSVLRAFRERFPMLRDLVIDHCWAGWCGFTPNFLPLVGRAMDRPAYHYAIGYNGHGIAQATAVGTLLADLMQGNANPWQELICRKPAFMPPKPLRYLGIKALLAILNGIDRRVDGKAKRANVDL